MKSLVVASVTERENVSNLVVVGVNACGMIGCRIYICNVKNDRCITYNRDVYSVGAMHEAKLTGGFGQPSRRQMICTAWQTWPSGHVTVAHGSWKDQK